jgi:hypothetical protein
VPDKGHKVLTRQQAIVLYVVWEEKQSPQSRGLNNEGIRAASSVAAKEAGLTFGISLQNIKKFACEPGTSPSAGKPGGK